MPTKNAVILKNGRKYEISAGDSISVFTRGPWGDRGVWGGGYDATNVMQYITISTTNSIASFGQLTRKRYGIGACSNYSRGVFSSGLDNVTWLNIIDYITIATTGNAVTFGEATCTRAYVGGCSNNIRGIFARSYSQNTNVIDYVTIAITGNAVDFGDCTLVYNNGSDYGCGACSDNIRGIMAGEYNNYQIVYCNIATTMNTVLFGYLSVNANRRRITALSSNTGKGLFCGGENINVIDYVSIQCLANAVDFGDLLATRQGASSVSNGTRGVITGGDGKNIIDYVTIEIASNASNFNCTTIDTMGYKGAVSGN